MAIIRNPDGFATTDFTTDIHGYFPRPLPWDVVEFFEDFGLGSSGLPYGWTNTNTNGTPTNTSGTYLVQTLGGADNDLSQMYPTTATFTVTAGKRAGFRWRGKVDKGSTGTILEQELYVGMAAAETGTNFIDAGGTALASTDYIGFVKYDGAANSIDLMSRKADVQSTEAAVATYVDVTWMTLSWDYDGDTTIKFYKDSKYLGSLSSNIPTAALTPMIYFKAGEAKAAVLTTDYIWFFSER